MACAMAPQRDCARCEAGGVKVGCPAAAARGAGATSHLHRRRSPAPRCQRGWTFLPPYGAALPSRAASRQSIMLRAANGLLKKQTAPASKARLRIGSLGNAVMNMMGRRSPSSIRASCISMPVMPGMATSAITHAVEATWGDCKNSAAHANVRAAYPSDLTKLSIATRTDGSSSTIEMVGTSCKCAGSGPLDVGEALPCCGEGACNSRGSWDAMLGATECSAFMVARALCRTVSQGKSVV